jgi:hypothetical protein
LSIGADLEKGARNHLVQDALIGAAVLLGMGFLYYVYTADQAKSSASDANAETNAALNQETQDQEISSLMSSLGGGGGGGGEVVTVSPGGTVTATPVPTVQPNPPSTITIPTVPKTTIAPPPSLTAPLSGGPAGATTTGGPGSPETLPAPTNAGPLGFNLTPDIHDSPATSGGIYPALESTIH